MKLTNRCSFPVRAILIDMGRSNPGIIADVPSGEVGEVIQPASADGPTFPDMVVAEQEDDHTGVSGVVRGSAATGSFPECESVVICVWHFEDRCPINLNAWRVEEWVD